MSIASVLDVRRGERALTARAFLLVLVLVAAHTVLETARDAFFLSTLAPSRLNIVYIALAVVTFFVGAASTWLALRLGRRRALAASLFVFAVITLLFRFVHHHTPVFAIGFYIYSGTIGALVIPQFWILAGDLFSPSQGRRLFNLLAAGSVIGAVFGASTAAVAISADGVHALFYVASALFVVALVIVAAFRNATLDAPREGAASARMSVALFRDNPLLSRIAVLMVLSTMTVLVVDYVFKSTAAHSMAPHELGPFFARYYAVTNAASLIVQLFVASRVLRRLGVVGANAYTPSLLGLGGVGVLVTGAFAAVAIVKAIDGALRYSLNKISVELLYLPLPSEARERGKVFIDGVLTRTAQAAAAVALYLIATSLTQRASTRVFAVLIVGLAVAWVASVVAVRRRYLALFRKALAGGQFDDQKLELDLDLGSAEVLVEGLASRNPEVVIGAMNLLAQKKHGKLIPALVLYHDAESVVVRALEIFSATTRTDWFPLAERLLDSPRDTLRLAAVRALVRCNVVSALDHVTGDANAQMRMYAAFQAVLREEHAELLDAPLVAKSFEKNDAEGARERYALLMAIADSPSPRASNAVIALARDADVMQLDDASTLIARSISAIGDPRFIPTLLGQLRTFAERRAARDALVQIGDEAFDTLVTAMRDPATDARMQAHIPRTISAFNNQRACDVLTEQLTTERNGFVRYKVLRGLNALIGAGVTFDVATMESICRKNLVDYLRTLALRVALAGPRGNVPTAEAHQTLLAGLLDDKIDQALERAFRLLKMMFVDEDIQRVYLVARSGDRAARTNALEYVDALILAGPRHEKTRDLFRVVLDDVGDVDRVRRAQPLVGSVAQTARAAIQELLDDPDDLVAMLAARHASALGDTSLVKAAARALERPEIADLGAEWFGRAAR